MSNIIVTKPKVDIDSNLLAEIEKQTHEMGQVVIHCIYENDTQEASLIRIWPSTYLYDKHSSHISDLVLAERISYYPIWTRVRSGQSFFSLVFSGLPKSCSSFDLIEDCKGGPHPFKVMDISRNQSDVYYVKL